MYFDTVSAVCVCVKMSVCDGVCVCVNMSVCDGVCVTCPPCEWMQSMMVLISSSNTPYVLGYVTMRAA